MVVLRWLERHFEEVICCTCLVIIAVSVFLQVVARYVFSIALHWTEEVSSFAMVWAVYMGASLCVRERYHIRIMVAVSALPAKMGRFVIFIADAFWAFFSLLMVQVSWEYLAVYWKYTKLTPSLHINEFYPQTILIIGYTLMFLRLAQTYVNWWRDGAEGLPGMLEEDLDMIIPEQEKQP